MFNHTSTNGKDPNFLKMRRLTYQNEAADMPDIEHARSTKVAQLH